MTLKCTREQFEALHNLFEKIVNEQHDDIKQSLAIDLMRPIHGKMNRRLKAKVKAHCGWNLSVTDVQAKIYYTFFDGLNLGPGFLYEQIIIDKHLKAINKIYA